jgi:hypothetical protein
MAVRCAPGTQMLRTAPALATQWGRPQTVKGPYLRGGRVQVRMKPKKKLGTPRRVPQTSV